MAVCPHKGLDLPTIHSELIISKMVYCADQWRKLTSDPEILETVTGQNIEFYQIPIQIKPPFQPKWSPEEAEFIDSEILSLVEKGVIQQSKHEQGEFISSEFLRPKKELAPIA